MRIRFYPESDNFNYLYDFMDALVADLKKQSDKPYLINLSYEEANEEFTYESDHGTIAQIWAHRYGWLLGRYERILTLVNFIRRFDQIPPDRIDDRRYAVIEGEVLGIKIAGYT